MRGRGCFWNEQFAVGIDLRQIQSHAALETVGCTSENGVENPQPVAWALNDRTMAGAGDETFGAAEDGIERDADRDNYMSAAQAAEYGLVDKVLTSSRDIAAQAAAEK